MELVAGWGIGPHHHRTFRIMDASYFPAGRHVIPMSIDGTLVWCLREGTPTEVLVHEMNVYSEHIVRHGLWVSRDTVEDTSPQTSRALTA